MTEREKMLRGQLYNANYDRELNEIRMRCKDLCYEFNHLKPSSVSEQERLVRDVCSEKRGTASALQRRFGAITAVTLKSVRIFTPITTV